MKRFLFVPVLALFSLGCAVPASGQWGRPDSRYGYGSGVTQIAYDNGYREGLRDGERDGRSRDGFRYQDERAFQRADIGYRRQYGDLGRYRQTFRQGFTDGYTEGYRRFSRGYGGYVPSRPGYGYGYPSGPGDRFVSAYENGARDGFEKGREDARDNDRFDPRRHRWYRDGDRHYNDRFGSRERYKDEYRRGFVAGYERGYYGR